MGAVRVRTLLRTSPENRVRKALQSVLLMLCGVLLACVAGEALVRVATSNQQNYVIEMWRYARLLKERSTDPQVGHEHRPNSEAQLQGVDVTINALGMRGPMPDPAIPPERTVAILGDSVAFGWGVEEPETLRGQLADALGPETQVLSTGVGNMNLTQIVAHWSHLRKNVRPATIIVLATARASEVQPPELRNWLVENSALAAMTVTYFRQVTSGATGRESMVDAYRSSWTDGPGLGAMRAAMDRLNAMEAEQGTRIIVALLPEPHDMNNYELGFMSDVMEREALQRGWEFVDLLPSLQGPPSSDFWVTAQDVHPNSKAFGRITARLAPLIMGEPAVQTSCSAGQKDNAGDCQHSR